MANESTENITHQWIELGGGTDSPITCAVGNIYIGGSHQTAKGALRFDNIIIGKNESFDIAKLVYKYSGVGATSGSWKFKLNGIDEDDTAPFGYPFGRTKTTAQNNYDEGPPTSGGTKEMDVKSIVEEITARSGWSSGNAIGFLLEDLGSSNDVHAYADLDDSYLVYRVASEPDFTPTPTTVSAPIIPSAEDFGIKISEPGVNVFNATEAEIYYTSRKKRFFIKDQEQITTSGVPHSIAHNLGYIPFVEVFVKSGSEWFKLPFMNFSGGSNIGYYEVDDTNLKIYTNSGSTVYYYIFLNELGT